MVRRACRAGSCRAWGGVPRPSNLLFVFRRLAVADEAGPRKLHPRLDRQSFGSRRIRQSGTGNGGRHSSRNTAPGTTGAGAARTPHHLLNGMITPNGVHFERSHSGIPDINPETHRLVIHGLVKRPLIFTFEALARYPMESRVAFLECGGNGQLLYQKEPAPVGVQAIHGLVSCAEWTGVKLSTLLDEAGVDPTARWILAEGADAAGMSRSVPLGKAMDDALIALFQNGERIRPSNGYPIRL